MSTRITLGNIGSSKHGVGSIPPSVTRTRAIEIAISDGRRAEDVTEHDYEAARVELAPSHSAPNQNLSPAHPSKDQSLGARLVDEGLSEAQHDLTLEAELEQNDQSIPE